MTFREGRLNLLETGRVECKSLETPREKRELLRNTPLMIYGEAEEKRTIQKESRKGK